MNELPFPRPTGRDARPAPESLNGSDRKREHPKDIGDRTTAHVLARLSDHYPYVYVPWGENTRTDLLVETEDGQFIRVQCKTGRHRSGAVRFNTCSFTYHHPGNGGQKPYMHDYRGQADVFGVYCPDTDAVYVIPVDDVGTRSASLRVVRPRNNQDSRVRWAKDYQLTPR